MAEERLAWHALQVWGGKEKKVKEVVEKTCSNNARLKTVLKQVLVPVELVLSSSSKGENKVKERVLMGGYVYVQSAMFYSKTVTSDNKKVAAKRGGQGDGDVREMINITHEWIMDPELETVLRNTSNVFGIIGPIPAAEIEAMVGHAEQKSEQLVDTVEYRVGDKVKVTSGPFSGFVGDVSEVNADKHELTVIVKVFGRETPLNLENSKVERAGV